MAQDQPIYPKKLGILILFSSAMDLTIKFGALPIYGNRFQHELGYRADGSRDALRRAEGSRRLEEDEICRRVVQEGRQGPRCPEHLPRFGQAQFRAVGLQEDQGRNHGDEDADEQLRHFSDGRVGKFVELTRFRLRRLEG